MTNEPMHRRTFLQAAAAALSLAGCTTNKQPVGQANKFSQAQRDQRKTGTSSAAIIACPSYDEDITTLLNNYKDQLSLPNLKGKRVVIKPNMIEYRPGKPVMANPVVVGAAAHFVDRLGAKEIIVAEGPGHFRDTEFLLEQSGIGAVLQKLSLPFVDLNLDELDKVDNKNGITKAKELFLPKTILTADAVISLPKLKTHHWVGMTASMKNFFGAVPGSKYGWPKNFLHWLGIDLAIIDLVRLIRPSFAIVDAIVAMEGDGPINGKANNAGFLVVGTDCAAVDAICARAIGIEPQQLKYLQIAEEIIGNTKLENIALFGCPLAQVHQNFEMPATFQHAVGSWQARRAGG